MKLPLSICALVYAGLTYAQSPDSILIKGQVISRDKQPLPGAIVRVSHTDRIVYTDSYGQFELWSPIEGILEFSCISEPYRVSLGSIGAGKKDELLKFEFDMRQQSRLKQTVLKGRTIKVNRIAPGRISNMIQGYYTSDFKSITQRSVSHYQSQHFTIIYMVDGKVMPENFNVSEIDPDSMRSVVIVKVIDNRDKVIFMISLRSSR